MQRAVTRPPLAIVVAVLTVLAAFSGRAYPATNLLANGGFESGSVSPWTGAAAAQVVSGAAYGGSYGVRLPTAQLLTQGWISVVPGRTYVVTAWFRWTAFAGTEWGYDTINVANSSWQTEAAANNLHSAYAQGTWHKIALSFVPRTNSVQVNLGVYGPKGTVDISFDEVQLFEKATNATPTAAPAATPTSGAAPLAVQFSAHADDPDGAIASFQWDFGDGSVSTDENPSHTFTAKGTYGVRLTAVDNEGARVSQPLSVTVTSDANPNLAITAPSTLDTYTTAGAVVQLSGTAGAPSGRTVQSVVWDNLNTDAAGAVTISPAGTVSWTTGPLALKPGVNEILVTATDSAGAVATDRLLVTCATSGPSISNPTLSQTNVAVYESVEVRFDLSTSADNPYFRYDPAPPPGVLAGTGVTVEALVTTPSGKVLRQPAFFKGEVTRTASGSSQHYEETGRAGWAVRITPMEAGSYAVALSAQDSSGSTQLSAGSFSASPPQGRGFVRVSQDDPRYFEYSSRDLFVPTGPASGTDYATYKGTGINLDRVWMGGQAAYSTNWSRWIRTDLSMGNEGYDSPLTFRERYPSHELSREIYWPEGRRIWMGQWGDENYYPALKAGTRYLVKVRLRTTGITGPAAAGVPYGFMIKTHAFPGSTIDSDLRARPSIIPAVSSNRGWHTIVATYTAPSDAASTPYFSLLLDNVTAGRVYIDQFSVKPLLADGTTGGELIRNSKADMHTYVEQRPAAYFDWQLQQGEANGVFFKYVVQDKRDWVPSHLSEYGAWVDLGDGYFQEDGTKAKWLQEQWWRYLAARWGHSTAVHSWESCNEADPSDAAVYRHTQDFASYLHTADSHYHLATTSFWCCWVPSLWTDLANYPDVDYADIHEYTKDSALGLDMAEWILSLDQTVRSSGAGKPVILGETGIGYSGQAYFEDLKRSNAGTWYHNMLWVQLAASSGISSPNYWWSEHLSQIDKSGIARPFSQFVSGLDLNRGGYVDAAASSSNAQVRVGGQKNLSRNSAVLWVQNKLHNWHNVMGVESPVAVAPQSATVTVRMAPSTTYTVERWNTYTGVLVASQSQQSDASGNVTITVSNLADDFAVRLRGPGSTGPAAPRNVRILQ
jgi:PKD repeat protein